MNFYDLPVKQLNIFVHCYNYLLNALMCHMPEEIDCYDLLTNTLRYIYGQVAMLSLSDLKI